jgi:hypothetical protein
MPKANYVCGFVNPPRVGPGKILQVRLSDANPPKDISAVGGLVVSMGIIPAIHEIGLHTARL